MIKITKKWLTHHEACCSESDKERAEKEFKGDINLICKALIKENRLEDANWLLIRIMNKKQKIQYAIFVAEKVLHAYEDHYPNDNGLRLVIKAAKASLESPCEEVKEDAASRTALAALVIDTAYFVARDAYVFQKAIIEKGLKILKGVNN